jgi:hypothetical protein
MSIDNAGVFDWNKAWKQHRENNHRSLEETKFTKPSAVQIGGDHYKLTKYQPIDVMVDWGLDPLAGNVIKYIQRHRWKNGIEDLQKAAHYLQMLIEKYDDVSSKYYK